MQAVHYAWGGVRSPAPEGGACGRFIVLVSVVRLQVPGEGQPARPPWVSSRKSDPLPAS